MGGPLVEVLPDRGRRIAYVVYAVVGLALGSVPVYCAATEAATPTPIVGLLAVYTFLGGPLMGAVAASNVGRPPR